MQLFKRVHLLIGQWLPALNFSVALWDQAQGTLSFPITWMTTRNGKK